jgi:hypothetical protein
LVTNQDVEKVVFSGGQRYALPFFSTPKAQKHAVLFWAKTAHLYRVIATQQKQAIVLLCYSRSGGTLFSKSLVNLPDVVLLSEVNPVLNAKGSIKEQLKNWQNLDIAEGSFAEMAKAAFVATNKNLIIRDFTFIDFTPHALNGLQPANTFSTLNALKNEMPLKPVAFVRDAFDVWISRGCPPKFSEGYLTYVKALLALKIPIYTYEDFCRNPAHVLRLFCTETGLPFDERALTLAIGETKVTGDVDLRNPSRGTRQMHIAPLKRKRLPAFLVKHAQQDLHLKQANVLLGYADDILSAETASAPTKISLELSWFFKRIFKKYPKEIF